MNGIIAIFLASIFSSAKDIMSKKIAFQINSSVSACTSFLFALPYYFVLLALMHFFGFKPFEYTGNFILFVFLRAIIDSLMEYLKMHALSYGEISFISNFFSLTPVFLIFLAPIITGDSVSTLGLVGVGVIIFGTGILLNAPKETIPWRGVVYATLAAFLASLNICFDRLAVGHADPIYAGFLMTLLSGLILYIPMIRVKNYKQQISNARLLLAQRGLLEILFMVIKLYGLKYLEPQYASGLQKIALVFSVAVGGKVFDERDRVRRIIASIVIVIGSILLIYAKLCDVS